MESIVCISEIKIQHPIIQNILKNEKFEVYHAIIEETDHEFVLKKFPNNELATKVS